MKDFVIDNKPTTKSIKEKLIRVGYLGDFDLDNIQDFLSIKYGFNIRDTECYVNYGGINDYRPALEYIPDMFFLKNYIENETETESMYRFLYFALCLIIELKRR